MYLTYQYKLNPVIITRIDKDRVTRCNRVVEAKASTDQGVVLLRPILIHCVDSLKLLKDEYEVKGQEHQSDALASGETAGITLFIESSGLISS